MQIRGELARVLITVKASPQPSAKYGDTVCVAGIRIDGGRADWIRLYPVPFRWLGGEQQFKKYDVVDLEVRRAVGDSRPESYKPDIETIRVVGHLDDWSRRQPIFERVVRTTTCQLSRAATERHDALSLGMVQVRSLDGLEFEVHPGWSDAEKLKIAASVQGTQLSLFSEPGRTPPELKAPRFKVRYRYRCMEADCPRHVGQILDWELTALQYRQRGSDAELKAAVEERFAAGMFEGRTTSFFMGNFEDPRKRHGFSVLGVHYPPAGIASRLGLFDLDSDA
ncbi:hypothetical protein [Protaetiibacter mangrovi]|uniref:Uncharacterized protein n=1 Tax=Protaetiibacter mangrovi TaxID=2970926 RepID=A0ABT1ZH48_9MICO|nr:hypothetical protein [Protaetiibacter mangrovi]MCS0500043.1 hypothetical protein [Protaetiibacter mangrovi]TPX02810.1 hypothetical protein FJ656_20470 [Schumannella luteola]